MQYSTLGVIERKKIPFSEKYNHFLAVLYFMFCYSTQAQDWMYAEEVEKLQGFFFYFEKFQFNSKTVTKTLSSCCFPSLEDKFYMLNKN